MPASCARCATWSASGARRASSGGRKCAAMLHVGAGPSAACSPAGGRGPRRPPEPGGAAKPDTPRAPRRRHAPRIIGSWSRSGCDRVFAPPIIPSHSHRNAACGGRLGRRCGRVVPRSFVRSASLSEGDGRAGGKAPFRLCRSRRFGAQRHGEGSPARRGRVPGQGCPRIVDVGPELCPDLAAGAHSLGPVVGVLRDLQGRRPAAGAAERLRLDLRSDDGGLHQDLHSRFFGERERREHGQHIRAVLPRPDLRDPGSNPLLPPALPGRGGVVAAGLPPLERRCLGALGRDRGQTRVQGFHPRSDLLDSGRGPPHLPRRDRDAGALAYAGPASARGQGDGSEGHGRPVLGAAGFWRRRDPGPAGGVVGRGREEGGDVEGGDLWHRLGLSVWGRQVAS